MSCMAKLAKWRSLESPTYNIIANEATELRSVASAVDS